MSRTGRRRRIAVLLRERPVGSQGELVAALRASGEPATQATVSRDLRAMGVVKGPDGYLPPAPDEGEAEAAAPAVRAVATADALVVVRTGVGHANAVGALLDRLRPPEMVGSVAGDDTIFLATPDRDAARRLASALVARFGLAPEEPDA